ncbi:MFS transporter [Chitinivorax sp. PXF-14]|uniref:MFS transporter n=1 Tax=Chitinivorax sp. PXF-14 TaxID=3230488 RepID=UPI003465CBDB
MPAQPAPHGPQRLLLLLNIALLVSLEFVQNGAVSFAAAFISGGIGAAPEEFSLAAAVYAATAVVMIFKHRWLVEQLGYRHFIRLSLALFVLGGVLCALSSNVGEFIGARFVQALGGSAFFTAGRVQVNRFQGVDRGTAVKFMVFGIVLGSGATPWLASLLLEHHAWQGVFLLPLPLAAGAVLLSEATLEDVVPHDSRSELHLGGTLLLAGAAFALQFVLERMQYDLFAEPRLLWLVGALALGGLLAFLFHEHGRERPLLPFRQFGGERYRSGLVMYGICYLVLSASYYMLPMFMTRGLGFGLLSTGALLGATSAFALLPVLVHFRLVRRFPAQRKYMVLAFLMLAGFGFEMSRMSPEVSQWQLVLPLLALSCFSAFGQGTAAMNAYVGIDDDVFSHAYQTKNMLRELLNSTGISLATIVLQSRSSLHYQRMVERLDAVTLANAGMPLAHVPTQQDASLLQAFASQIAQQATQLACLDFFRALVWLAAVATAIALLQRKIR